jgi:hypothetical protein
MTIVSVRAWLPLFLIACGARTELGAGGLVGDGGVPLPDVHVVDAQPPIDAKPKVDGPNPCVFPDITATIATTADDEFELFVNDQLVGGNSDWTEAKAYTVAIHRDPGMVNVIAIKGTNLQNTGGRDRGVLLDMRFSTEAGNQFVVTDTKWRMATSVTTPNWSGTTFDDSSWKTAVSEGAYPECPWGNVLGISSNAEWLWSYDSNQPSNAKVVMESVYFRRDFYIDASGHIVDAPGVCD